MWHGLSSPWFCGGGPKLSCDLTVQSGVKVDLPIFLFPQGFGTVEKD